MNENRFLKKGEKGENRRKQQGDKWEGEVPESLNPQFPGMVQHKGLGCKNKTA